MTSTPALPAPSVGRFTGLVLGLVVFACVTMIGVAGYLKFELDRAQVELASPEVALAPDQEVFQKLRRALGYSGFTGLAQTYATTHDVSVVPDMKADLKQANDIITHMPDKTPADARHDLQAIYTVFDQAMQKVDKSASDPSAALMPNDMAPLYSALPILDARVASTAASVRVGAQSKVQYWAMLLTLVSWGSLIIASALAAGIYLTLRDRNSAPLRALSQSVKNMARGDMRTPIWGMERQDTLGELARAVDMARFQFSQLPDLALLSDQGPVRIRFEGNTRSLFEAMMRVISRDSEQVHQQTASLTDAIEKQQKTLAALTFKVENVLQNVQTYAVNGDQQVRDALANIITSAENLSHSQEHAADQLNRIIPYMQDRAQGLAEIAQITGKQVGQVLQTIMMTGRGLKANADESDAAIKKLSASAGELGERLFGAVNLLQASGKVLSETTDAVRSRLDEAIASLNPGSEATASAADMSEELGNLGAAMGQIIGRLDDDFGGRLTQMANQAPQLVQVGSGDGERTAALVESGIAEIKAVLAVLEQDMQRMHERANGAATEPATALPENAMLEIKTGIELLGQKIELLYQQANDVDSERASMLSDSVMQEIKAGIAVLGQDMQRMLERANDADSERASMLSDNVMLEIKTGFEVLGQNMERMREQVRALTIAGAASPDGSNLPAQMRDQWSQMAGQIEATRAALEQAFTQQIGKLGERMAVTGAPADITPNPETELLHEAQRQMEQQTQILGELVATLGALDAHMQEISHRVSDIKRAG